MQEKSDIYGQVKALTLKTKDGYEELSYIEISRKAKKFANYLIETLNVQRGERIAIICESRPEFSIGMFASIQTGAITVPLDVKLTVPEHRHILNDCNPRILLCSTQLRLRIMFRLLNIFLFLMMKKEHILKLNQFQHLKPILKKI